MILLPSLLLAKPQTLLFSIQSIIFLLILVDSLSLSAISKKLFFTKFQKRKRKNKSNKV